MTSYIFGVRLDDAPSEGLREVLERFLDGDRTSRIFTPNPEILLRARDDPAYAEVMNTADLALPDGTGVAMVEMLRQRRRVPRWPGVEIGGMLLRMAADRGATVVFFGGSTEAAERAADRWRRALPGVRIELVGTGATVTEDGIAWPAHSDADLTRAIDAGAPGDRPRRTRRPEAGAVDRSERGCHRVCSDHDRGRWCVRHVGGTSPPGASVAPSARTRVGLEACTRTGPPAQGDPRNDHLSGTSAVRSY